LQDIDSALIQAQRLSDESKFREILEITLRYDLELYQKCKAVESLLLFQCKSTSCKIIIIIFAANFDFII